MIAGLSPFQEQPFLQILFENGLHLDSFDYPDTKKKLDTYRGNPHWKFSLKINTEIFFSFQADSFLENFEVKYYPFSDKIYPFYKEKTTLEDVQELFFDWISSLALELVCMEENEKLMEQSVRKPNPVTDTKEQQTEFNTVLEKLKYIEQANFELANYSADELVEMREEINQKLDFIIEKNSGINWNSIMLSTFFKMAIEKGVAPEVINLIKAKLENVHLLNS